MALRIRPSLHTLQIKYLSGDKEPLEKLWRAWKGIKELPFDQQKSFFVLGGYHGEPFRGKGETDYKYWGGYCAHGNILFPLWHRIYLIELEKALQSIEGCGDVMLPYWDQTNELTKDEGIPWALTREYIELDGQKIKNPLASYVLPVELVDKTEDPSSPGYSKPEGYETVRYPLSGLVSNPEQVEATEKHNAKYPTAYVQRLFLNFNVQYWLYAPTVYNIDDKPIYTSVHDLFESCLSAPNYTVFSNTTSQNAWNKIHKTIPVVALEKPHNAIHLCVGGFAWLDVNLNPTARFANGDMGENNTAGFDPIFFFHHCNIDRMFWLWQKLHGATDALEIIPNFPGTTNDYKVTGQGPTVGYPDLPVSLDLQSPLYPFTKQDGQTYVGQDLINIHKLGFDYAVGSFEVSIPGQALVAPVPKKLDPSLPSYEINVNGVNRAQVPGSYIIAIYATVDGKKSVIGYEPVLSRWNIKGCANCQQHLDTPAVVVIQTNRKVVLKGTEQSADPSQVVVEVGVVTHGEYAEITQDTSKFAPNVPPPTKPYVQGAYAEIKQI